MCFGWLVLRGKTGGRDLEFDSRTGQIGHTVANDSPPLRGFSKLLPKRLAAEMGLAARNSFQRSTAGILKI